MGNAPAAFASEVGVSSEVRLTPVQITSARQINPTTVEVLYANGQHVTFDFYGENIFRIFQDNAGGIVRDPAAKPEAHILVNNPRRSTGGVKLETADKAVVIKTPRIAVNIDRTSGLLTVTKLATGEKVIEGVSPIEIGEKKTTITLKERDGEYF